MIREKRKQKADGNMLLDNLNSLIKIEKPYRIETKMRKLDSWHSTNIQQHKACGVGSGSTNKTTKTAR